MKQRKIIAALCSIALAGCALHTRGDGVSLTIEELRAAPEVYLDSRACITGVAYNRNWRWIKLSTTEVDYPPVAQIAPDNWPQSLRHGESVRVCGVVKIDDECFKSGELSRNDGRQPAICSPKQIMLIRSVYTKPPST